MAYDVSKTNKFKYEIILNWTDVALYLPHLGTSIPAVYSWIYDHIRALCLKQ